jgi:Asp/Glu/hydantoin racemase
MKEISIIMLVNNHEIFNEEDLKPYQTSGCHFNLSYPDTPLKQLNTAEEVEQVLPLIMDMIEAASKSSSAIILYGFGDLAMNEVYKRTAVPVMSLGRIAVHVASAICRNKFSVIPGHLEHNGFIEALVKSQGLEHNFISSHGSINMDPAEIRSNTSLLDRLIEVANVEIEQYGVGTFTLGCGSFVGVATQLQNKLREIHKQPITVVDPIEVTFNVAKSL